MQSNQVVCRTVFISYIPDETGDLTIRLVDADDSTRPRELLPSIPIPDDLAHPHDVVLNLGQLGNGWRVSADQRTRALSNRPRYRWRSGAPRLRVWPTTRQRAEFPHHDRRGRLRFHNHGGRRSDRPVSDDEIQSKRYEWQRVSPKKTKVPSGRLVIELSGGYPPRRWADRKRSRGDATLTRYP